MSSDMEPRPVPAAFVVEMSTDPKREKQTVTLGSVRYRHQDTNKIILVPTPSSDPNDPLNWSQAYKYYMTFLVCLAMFMCTLLAAGPTIAIVEIAKEFFPDWERMGLSKAIGKTAYFFTTTALLQGSGNLFWMPLVNKYGRRPVYITSYTLYLVFATWAAVSHRYSGVLAARILMGFASGAAETMAPLSIADVFFLHERGTIMAWYTASLSGGVAGGIIIAGLITIHYRWRVIYYVAIALIGLVLILAFFTFPETAFIRNIDEISTESPIPISRQAEEKNVYAPPVVLDKSVVDAANKDTYLQTLRIWSGIYTEESLLKLFIRPLALVLLPPVLWSALTMAVTIGFLVAVTSNVSYAFEKTYGFRPYQTGLCFFSSIIGSLLGVYCGGSLSDKVADFLTTRNGGIREPEMRLPAILISCITAPLALILYGVGIQHRFHWICPTIGLGLLNLSIVQATNISLVYTIDAYRPIAGEVTLTSMGFKSAFGFLLSFYTNPWIDEVGYQKAYGSMAGIALAVLLCWVPLFVWGKRIRHATWKWKVASFVKWDDDREIGE